LHSAVAQKKALNSLKRFAEIRPPLGAGNCKERGKSDAWQKTNYISCLQTITLWPGIIFFLGCGGVCRWEKITKKERWQITRAFSFKMQQRRLDYTQSENVTPPAEKAGAQAIREWQRRNFMLELLPVEAWRLRIKQASRPTRFLRAKLLFAVIICDAASDCQAERRKLFEPFPDFSRYRRQSEFIEWKYKCSEGKEDLEIQKI